MKQLRGLYAKRSLLSERPTCNTGVSYVFLRNVVISYASNSVVFPMQALSICVLTVGITYRW